MANDVVIHVKGDTAHAEKALRSIQDRLRSVADQARKWGIGLSALGAAGVFAIKSFTAAALEQQRALAIVGTLVEATGASFDQYRESILSATAALQKKTNFGDEQQLRVLARMIPVLGSVDKAMAALPLVLDAASSSGLQVESVAGTLSRALAGLANVSESLGISFDESAGFTERLDQGFAKVRGTAEANADPFIQFSNAVGDLKEKIGEELLPIITPFVNKMKSLVEAAQEPESAFRRLLRPITAVAIAITGLAVVGGPIFLFLSVLPSFLKGMTAVVTGLRAIAATSLFAHKRLLLIPIAMYGASVFAGRFTTAVQSGMGAAEAFGEVWKGIGSDVNQAMDFIVDASSDLLPPMKDLLEGVDQLTEGFSEMGDTGTGASVRLTDALEEIVGALGGVGPGLFAGVSGLLGPSDLAARAQSFLNRILPFDAADLRTRAAQISMAIADAIKQLSVTGDPLLAVSIRLSRQEREVLLEAAEQLEAVEREIARDLEEQLRLELERIAALEKAARLRKEMAFMEGLLKGPSEVFEEALTRGLPSYRRGGPFPFGERVIGRGGGGRKMEVVEDGPLLMDELGLNPMDFFPGTPFPVMVNVNLDGNELGAAVGGAAVDEEQTKSS